jgi:uncharacterized Rmd1/YagE family protein
VTLPAIRPLRVRARLVGSRINVRAFETGEPLALHPLTIRAGQRGLAVLFRFGAVVLVDVDPVEEAAFGASLQPFVIEPYATIESEEIDVVVEPEARDRLDAGGVLRLHAVGVPHWQVIAHVLAKSTALAYHEQQAGRIAERIEELALELKRGARGPSRGNELLGQIGDVLLAQARTVGRAEVAEKPEITWDDPGLDRLYEHLAAEFELRDRDRALTRKLDLASHTVETYLELLNNRQSLRVEWYIVILILVEIALIVYEMLVGRR